MKCTRCSKDCKFSERTSGHCPSCKGKFAFEPRAGDLLTDAAFAGALERVSSHHAVRFSNEHLYYELLRSLPKPGRLPPMLKLLKVACRQLVLSLTRQQHRQN